MAAVPLVSAAPPGAPAEPARHIGRFRLRRLLGKSGRTMSWWVDGPRQGQELILALPRERPADAEAARRWHQAARRAARIDHPSLARVVEVGEVDHWPFIAFDPGQATALSTALAPQGQPALEMANWACQVLEGLAFAHEAGMAHHDVQAHMVLLPGQGPARLLGLGVAMNSHLGMNQDLQLQRRAAERDLLALGLLMHQALTGHPALEQTDVGEAVARLPPQGREIIRLPWTAAHPIPEALRAIVNRATDRQERQRYRSARTLLRAVEGWRKAEGEHGAGALALVLDRLRSGGLLPATPGAAQRAARMALMDRERNDELAEVVLQDTALTFEMIRLVNSAQVRGAMAAGSGPILTIRRSIDMLGLEGVRRAALSLRAWPGSMSDDQASGLEHLIERTRRAGRIAQWLRPAGYDSELVFLLAMLQNLGRLVARYHFPDEAMQIERLMKPTPSLQAGAPDEPGMGEAAASFAVLGVDLAAIGQAIGHHWGLDEQVLRMVERQPADAPVRFHGSDVELLRLTASCANEVVDAGAMPVHQQLQALQRVAQRYSRALGVTLHDLQAVAQGTPPAPAPPTNASPTQHGALT